MTEISVMLPAEGACSNVRLTGAEHGTWHRTEYFARRISATIAQYAVYGMAAPLQRPRPLVEGRWGGGRWKYSHPRERPHIMS